MVTKRKVLSRDLEQIKDFVKGELEKRKGSKYRKNKENIWREVDRQIAMKPERELPADDWHNMIELGALADASEISSADALRLLFPSDRSWYNPHVEIETEIDEYGDMEPVDPTLQKQKNGVLRSLMSQQHSDTGFRDRVKLTLKEALHHGSYVVECRWENFPRFHDGTKIEQLGAPVWVPHSMWNCYPDPSVSVIGTDLFYRGSMIIEEKMPWAKALQMPGWINKKKMEGDKRKDLDVIYFYGDIFVPRKGDGLFFPNQKVTICGDQIQKVETNPTPYIPIIYGWNERDDVRDPYGTSPIIKVSPTSKAATHNLNKFLDAVDLHTEPHIFYNSLDPAFADGFQVSPRGSTPTKGTADFKEIAVGDPLVALRGFELNLEQVERSTGVDATRSGVSAAVEQTAFEVSKKDQRSEVRLVDFVATFERQALKAFLYMQHDLNKKNLENYPFYNNEINTADFLRASKKDLDEHAKSVHFEITGSKGTLGEERRREGSMIVTERLMQSEMGQKLVNLPEIAKDAYSDFGVKDPERYLNVEEGENPELQALQAQYEEVIQQLQQQLAQLDEQVQKDSLLKEKHQAEKEKLSAKVESLTNQVDLIEEQKQLSEAQRIASEKIDKESDRLKEEKVKFELEKRDVVNKLQKERESNKPKEESKVDQVIKRVDEAEKSRLETQKKIFKFIESQGGKAAEFVRGLD